MNKVSQLFKVLSEFLETHQIEGSNADMFLKVATERQIDLSDASQLLSLHKELSDGYWEAQEEDGQSEKLTKRDIDSWSSATLKQNLKTMAPEIERVLNGK